MKDMIGWYEWGIWNEGYGMRIWNEDMNEYMEWGYEWVYGMRIWMSIWNEGSFSYKIHRMTLE